MPCWEEPSVSLCSRTASAASRSLIFASSRPHEPTIGLSTTGYPMASIASSAASRVKVTTVFGTGRPARASAAVVRILSPQMRATRALPTVNRARVARICGDKILTTAALAQAGVPVPKTVVTFTRDAALEAIEAMGYPVVLKPMVGSWGRLLAKINDRDAAEAVLEHKETLGSYQHGIFYIQEYVNKPERDIRAIVVGDQIIGAIYRRSEHWITNTARNGKASTCEVTPEIDQLCRKAAAAVGGGFLSVDLLEHQDGLLVNELNYTPEFHGFMNATGIPVADHVIDYVQQVGARQAVA